MRKENFDNIKVCDKVVVCSAWGKRIEEVTKVTPKRFKIGATQYEKKDGTEYGCGYCACTYCLHVTDAILDEIARNMRFVMMRRVLRNANVDRFNYAETKKLYDFMLENSLIEEPKE